MSLAFFTQHSSLEIHPGYVVAFVSSLFLFNSLVMFHVVDVPQIVYCSSMEDHLGCYQFGAIIGFCTDFIQVVVKCKSNVFSLWNKYVGVQVLDHVVVIRASLVTQW